MRFGLNATISFACVASLTAFASGEVKAADHHQDQEAKGPTVTVYSTADPAGFDPQRFIAQQRLGYDPNYAWQVPGFAVVKQVRAVDLEEGVNTWRITDVAQFIDPTTVSVVDLSDGEAATVVEQSFEFDLVSPSKLLEKFTDREITVYVPAGDHINAVTGKLLSSNQGRLVLSTDDGLRIVDATHQLKLGDLPDGLITQPTLVWQIFAPKAGERRMRTAYQTEGVTWRADYNLILNEDDTAADLGAWVSLMNLSGATWENAQLKLIAGDVQRVEQRPQLDYMRGRLAMEGAPAGFEEKAFFEYHLYTLPRRVDIATNTTQQITLFPTVQDVPVERRLVYYGASGNYGFFPDPMTDRNFGVQSNTKIDVYIRFENDEASGLGRPMPRGKVRVYKADDADGSLEFIGEDLIDHTPRNETLLVKVGQAFDVVGERTQTDFTSNLAQREMTESIEIKLRNHKDEAVNVLVKENLYRWSNWEIVNASHEFEKMDVRTIHFDVPVESDGESVVTYTVRYWW
ncbi:MAG: DUF4139 domain-containing protein [Phycisphaerales bacterium]